MPLPRPCLDCGALSTKSRCETCNRELERRRSAARPPRKHYAGDYRKRAKAVRESAGACWLCGDGPRPNDPWQADHVVPGDPASPLAAAHRSCNIRRANEMRAAEGRG